MIYFRLFTEAVDKITQNYVRQQATDRKARERWQSELVQVRNFYKGHLVDWSTRPLRLPAIDEQHPELLDEFRLTADDLTLGEFTRICKTREGCAGLYPLMQTVAKTYGQDWQEVFKTYCHTVDQRQAAFESFADLAQNVLEADPEVLPRTDLGFLNRGWLDRQPLALPFSTVWANTRRDASDVMGYTDRVQL